MSKSMTVQAQVPEKKDATGKVVQAAIGPYTITVQTGETAVEMIAMFGDSVVKSNADANWVVTIQGNMRSGMKKGETQEAMQARLGNAKMGAATTGIKIDPEQAYLAMFQAATPEKRAQMLEDLKKKASGK